MEQLTKKQERALDKMIKVIMSKYPFITGWKPSDDFLDYDTMANITFMADLDKLSEFFNAKPEPYYRRVINDEGNADVFSLGTPFDYDTYPHIKDLSYNTTKKIENLLNSMNQELPEEFQITYPYTNFRGEDVILPRQLRRDRYLLT